MAHGLISYLTLRPALHPSQVEAAPNLRLSSAGAGTRLNCPSQSTVMSPVELVDDPAPSYEESVGCANTSSTKLGGDKAASPAGFAAQLSEVRRKRINTLINTQILPLVNEHVSSGISQATFAFILSDLSEHWRIADEQALNLSHSGFTRIARLQGDGNTVQFWQQAQVLAQLDATMTERLGITDLASKPTPVLSVKSVHVPEQPRMKWFWQRSRGSSESGSMFQQGGAGWKAGEPDELDAALRISLREISVRATTNMGLYQTVHCPAVVITSNLEVT